MLFSEPCLEDTSPIVQWLRDRFQEQDHDFAIVERDYLNKLSIHLHQDASNRIRLVKIRVNKPIESYKSLGSNKEVEAPVRVTSYWLDSWAGPPETPNPEPSDNEEFEFDLLLSSCRDYGWYNFDGILLLDLSKFSTNAADIKTKKLFHPGTQIVRCIFVSGITNGRSFQFTVVVLDEWTLLKPEESEIANIPQSKFSSAIFLGDRLIEMGTDNCCVVVSIVNQPGIGADPEAAPLWTCTVAWDNKERKSEEVRVDALESRFVLVSTNRPHISLLFSMETSFIFFFLITMKVSHADPVYWDQMSPPLATKPSKKPKNKGKGKAGATSKSAPLPKALTPATLGNSKGDVTNELLMKTQTLIVHSEKRGKKTETTNDALKREAIALIEVIKSKFGIKDEKEAENLAEFATGADTLQKSRPTGMREVNASEPPATFKIYSLHFGVLNELLLRNWANDAGFRIGPELLKYHSDLTKPNKPWKVFTPANLGDFLYDIIGKARPPNGWYDSVAHDFNLQKYERLHELVHEAKQIMPAEYQVHLDHHTRNSSLRSTLMRIMLRISWMFTCPVEFTLAQNALVRRSAFARRNWGEMDIAPQIKVFRALCEYLVFGQNTTFFCSVYNISREQLGISLEWLETNLTVKESSSFGWFFKSTRLTASSTPAEGSTMFSPSKLAPFWEHSPVDVQYLEQMSKLFSTKDITMEGNVFKDMPPAFKQEFFILAFSSVHLVEEAIDMAPMFQEVSQINVYMDDLKEVLTPSLRTILDERLTAISSGYVDHELADDCLLVAQHWAEILSASTWTGGQKEASDLCERLLSSKSTLHDSNRTFGDIANAPKRVQLLQLLLDATDKNISGVDLIKKYKCTENALLSVMNLVASFCPTGVEERDAEHFNVKRIGYVQGETISFAYESVASELTKS